jgi:hypothetical protein
MSYVSMLALIVIVCGIFGYLAGEAHAKKRNRHKYQSCATPSGKVSRAFIRALLRGHQS